ncbi:MAG: DNA gyrase subunit A [Hyphomonadaceae bacterium]
MQKTKAGRAAGRRDREQEGALLGDVRIESAEDIRLVLEPKSRTVEPEILMESLFKLTALESSASLNMNINKAAPAPTRVMGLKEVLRAFLDHRRDVLQRRTGYRLGRSPSVWTHCWPAC